MSTVPPLAAHWIDGRPVEGAHAFDVASAGGGGPELRRYPRAAAEEVARALEAARRGGVAWSARPYGERRALLERAAERLGAGAGDEAGLLWRALGARIGLVRHELDLVRDEAAAAAVQLARDGDTSELVLVAAHWSELVQGTAGRVFAALARGAPVVLVSDPRAPMAAELVAEALCDIELDAGAFALLHDDVDRVVRELAAVPECVRLVVSAPAAELARRFPTPRRGRADDEDGACRGDEGARPGPGGTGAFGAGLGPGGAAAFGAGLGLGHGASRRATGARWAPVPLAAGTLVVDDEGLEEAAERVVRAALSRFPALSGQRPGQLGRVLVPERRLSRFTELLLARLETDSDLARPVPPIDREEVRERRRARALGIDEGATLIWSGTPPTADTGGETAADGLAAPSDGGGRGRTQARPSSHARDERASLLASVFTNVEPAGRLCDLSRPLPLLRLVRVGDGAAGRRLAEELGARAADPGARASALVQPSDARH